MVTPILAMILAITCMDAFPSILQYLFKLFWLTYLCQITCSTRNCIIENDITVKLVSFLVIAFVFLYLYMVRISSEIVTQSQTDTSCKHICSFLSIHILHWQQDLDGFRMKLMIEIHFLKILIRLIHVSLILVLAERIV